MKSGVLLRRDQGLQPERTYLAWARTATSWLAGMALFVRWAMFDRPLPLLLAVIAGVLGLVGVGRVLRDRYPHMRPPAGVRRSTDGILPLLASAMAVLTGTSCLLFVIAGIGQQ